MADDSEAQDQPRGEMQTRTLAMPADANPSGDIFGGWVLAQMDVAGGIAAAQIARGRVATVAVKEFRFLSPVAVGDLVSCYAEIRHRGNTSITVHVIAEACRQLEANSVHEVADATLVYVALAPDGRPRRLDD